MKKILTTIDYTTAILLIAFGLFNAVRSFIELQYISTVLFLGLVTIGIAMLVVKIDDNS